MHSSFIPLAWSAFKKGTTAWYIIRVSRGLSQKPLQEATVSEPSGNVECRGATGIVRGGEASGSALVQSVEFLSDPRTNPTVLETLAPRETVVDATAGTMESTSHANARPGGTDAQILHQKI